MSEEKSEDIQKSGNFLFAMFREGGLGRKPAAWLTIMIGLLFTGWQIWNHASKSEESNNGYQGSKDNHGSAGGGVVGPVNGSVTIQNNFAAPTTETPKTNKVEPTSPPQPKKTSKESAKPLPMVTPANNGCQVIAGRDINGPVECNLGPVQRHISSSSEIETILREHPATFRITYQSASTDGRSLAEEISSRLIAVGWVEAGKPHAASLFGGDQGTIGIFVRPGFGASPNNRDPQRTDVDLGSAAGGIYNLLHGSKLEVDFRIADIPTDSPMAADVRIVIL